MNSNSFQTKIEKSTGVSQRITVTVPASFLQKKFDRQLADVQKKAKLKGFRPGHVPMQLVKEYYGPELKSEVFRKAIDESYREVLKEHQIKAVGQPKIEPQNADAALEFSGKDLIYTATVEVMPEIPLKSYQGLSLKKEKSEVGDKDVEEAVTHFLNGHAELIPSEDENQKIKKGDFVDFSFQGGIVTETGVDEMPGMKGQRVIEIGSNGLIPGFEEQMEGLKRGDNKTFRISFPAEYDEKSLAGKEAEFKVDIKEIKTKKLPELTDEFCKENGYESVADLRVKARESIEKSKAETADQKIRGELLQALIEKNPFDVPQALIQAQLRSLAQEVSQDLKQRGFTDQMIQEALAGEFENLQKRAENQVRAGLLLDAIAKAEKLEVKEADYEKHFREMAANMKMDYDKIRDFYEKNPERKENFQFRILEDLTIQFLIGKAKVKEA
jgi:trigger factor